MSYVFNASCTPTTGVHHASPQQILPKCILTSSTIPEPQSTPAPALCQTYLTSDPRVQQSPCKSTSAEHVIWTKRTECFKLLIWKASDECRPNNVIHTIYTHPCIRLTTPTQHHTNYSKNPSSSSAAISAAGSSRHDGVFQPASAIAMG
jgi:hypothetical protein